MRIRSRSHYATGAAPILLLSLKIRQISGFREKPQVLPVFIIDFLLLALALEPVLRRLRGHGDPLVGEERPREAGGGREGDVVPRGGGGRQTSYSESEIISHNSIFCQSNPIGAQKIFPNSNSIMSTATGTTI